MKKIFVILSIVALFAACVDKDNVKQIDTANLSPVKEKTAPIREGYRTIITANGDTICSAVAAVPYFLPKGTTEKIEYVPFTKGYQNDGISQVDNQFHLCFEDTKNGDNDYNDFACYMSLHRTHVNPNGVPHCTLEMCIQPVAYGAGIQNLKFGVKLSNGAIYILADNIRNTYFPGTTGFVNVLASQMESPYQTNDINHIKHYKFQIDGSNDVRVNPFIINGSDTIYVALHQHSLEGITYSDMVSSKGYPYGIAIINSDNFRHAIEKIPISTIYYNFTRWINGQDDVLDVDWNGHDHSKTFNYNNNFINKNCWNLYPINYGKSKKMRK